MTLQSALRLAAAIALWACAGAAHADKVDDFVKAQMARQHIPGVTLAVIRNGKVVKSQGYGAANLELGVPAAPDSVFKIGSLSKQFIAAGIMVLNQDGKLGLDDPVSKYLTDAPPTWRAITIRHLLTHTAGLGDEAPGFDYLKAQSDINVIRTAYPVPLAYETGKNYRYSNLGYFILAEIIARASGEPWPKFIRDHVFTPAGMSVSRETNNEELIAHRAAGYDWVTSAEAYRNTGYIAALRPSGAFLSSLQDLIKWDAALRAGKVLSAPSQAMMQTPVKLVDGSTRPYGFGWQIASVNGHRQIWHSGTLPGFRAHMSRYVDDGVSVIVLTNASAAQPERIAKGVAAEYIPGLIAHRASIAVPTALLDSYAGRYQLSGGRVLELRRGPNGLQMTLSVGFLTMDSGDLLAESETRFFPAEDPGAGTYTFSKDAQGRLQFVIENADGRKAAPSPRLP